jgi:hypothetical protein
MKPNPRKGARMLRIAMARKRSKNRSVITVADNGYSLPLDFKPPLPIPYFLPIIL